MVKILVGCTGSVATIKLPNLIKGLMTDIKDKDDSNLEVKVIVTEHAKHFFNKHELPNHLQIYTDEDEWLAWEKRGDPVLHIELAKWADVFLIAPLDANTLAKISNGICDNLLTCATRAWDIGKLLIFCPAMNTKMYNHPLTEEQISKLLSWGYKQVPVIEKKLICGDIGPGAMAEVHTIIQFLNEVLG